MEEEKKGRRATVVGEGERCGHAMQVITCELRLRIGYAALLVGHAFLTEASLKEKPRQKW